MHCIFETQQPSLALVIGTYAAVPYVHLALESWRRYYPSVPLLVNDDASPAAAELAYLCRLYGADFHGSSRHAGHRLGDVSSYLYGLQWADSFGIDVLVKMSRRFIPLHDWTQGLRSLAWESQYATFSQRCVHFNYGFRTECIGFHVPTWNSPAIRRDFVETMERHEPIFVEGYVHQLARRIQTSACDLNRWHQMLNPRRPDSDAYGIWPIMPDRRTTKKPDILWHDCDSPADYCRVANLFGLKYTLEDFADPNVAPAPAVRTAASHPFSLV